LWPLIRLFQLQLVAQSGVRLAGGYREVPAFDAEDLGPLLRRGVQRGNRYTTWLEL
jgi:hypothetical protein